MVTENWQHLMKFLSDRSNSGILCFQTTTSLANHNAKIIKVGYLLKLDIRKLYVLLHSRWWRDFISAVLTYKFWIFLEKTFYVGAFVIHFLHLVHRIEFLPTPDIKTLHGDFAVPFLTLSSWYLHCMILDFCKLTLKPWFSRLGFQTRNFFLSSLIGSA